MKSIAIAALVAGAALTASPAMAQTFTLDFEGAAGYVNPILEFYNGGTDSLGQTGPNLGVSFTEAAVALSNDVLGPYYSNAPSPLTVMYAADATALMNVAAGFTGGLSFAYSSSEIVLDAVKIYSGLNGTGTLLASANLSGNAAIGCSDTAFCRFDLTSLQFAGVAQSISFGGGTPNVLFDDITITVVPEPGTYAMLLAGLGVVSLLVRRRQG
jgi:PEP-CTERM motif